MNYLVTDWSGVVVSAFEDYSSAEAKAQELAGSKPGLSFLVFQAIAIARVAVPLAQVTKTKLPKDTPIGINEVQELTGSVANPKPIS